MPVIDYDYEPREAFLPFHSRNERFGSMVCHRRAGKTVACINDLIAKASYTKKKNARYAYIAPFYRQAKDVAWEYLKQGAAKAIVGKPRESELRIILFNGAWITLYGADNPDAFRGMYFDGVVIDEYGDMRPKLWSENILPTLADRQGWAVFIGTPKGPNHFKDMHERAEKEEGWFAFTLKASESGILPDAELLLQRGEMDEDEYEQEYECSFTAAVKGTYYSKKLLEYEQNQNLKGLYDPTLPVQIAMDIGKSDNAAMWAWQETRDGINIVHTHELPGTDPEYWDDYWTKQGFDIETLWLPHDAKAQTFATKRSTLEQFMDMNYNAELVPKLSVQDGINAARMMIPICYFDEQCYEGLQCLYSYKRMWNDAKKVFSDKHDHDWAVDTADAFRYMSLVAKQSYGTIAQKKNLKDYQGRPEPLDPIEYKLDELWKDHEASLGQKDTLRIH